VIESRPDQVYLERRAPCFLFLELRTLVKEKACTQRRNRGMMDHGGKMGTACALLLDSGALTHSHTLARARSRSLWWLMSRCGLWWWSAGVCVRCAALSALSRSVSSCLSSPMALAFDHHLLLASEDTRWAWTYTKIRHNSNKLKADTHHKIDLNAASAMPHFHHPSAPSAHQSLDPETFQERQAV
jgi:hypothetical protein